MTANAQPAYHLYVVRADDRDALAQGARRAGIESRAYYTPPLHRQPAMERFSPGRGFPVAERLADECLALPMGTALNRRDIKRVVNAVGATVQAPLRA